MEPCYPLPVSRLGKVVEPPPAEAACEPLGHDGEEREGLVEILARKQPPTQGHQGRRHCVLIASCPDKQYQDDQSETDLHASEPDSRKPSRVGHERSSGLCTARTRRPGRVFPIRLPFWDGEIYRTDSGTESSDPVARNGAGRNLTELHAFQARTPVIR